MEKILTQLSLPSEKVHSSNFLKRNVWGSGIGSIVIFRLSELWKARFFIPCDVIFLVRLQGKIRIWSLLGVKGLIAWKPEALSLVMFLCSYVRKTLTQCQQNARESPPGRTVAGALYSSCAHQGLGMGQRISLPCALPPEGIGSHWAVCPEMTSRSKGSGSSS